MGLLSWIIVGLIAGWLANQMMRGGRGNAATDIVVGIIGGLVGGFLAGELFGVPNAVNGVNVGSIVVGTYGRLECNGTCEVRVKNRVAVSANAFVGIFGANAVDMTGMKLFVEGANGVNTPTGTPAAAAFGSLHGLSLGHAEDGQLQAPPNGKQPERNHHHHASRKRTRPLQPKRLQKQVESDTHDCGSGVEVSPQDEGHLRRDDIPQDPSGYTGHRAHQHHDDRWALRRFCHLGSRQRKQRQS